MTQRPTSQSKTRESSRGVPKCLLRWTIDPASGKAVARWTAEQAETIAISELSAAA